MIPHWGNIIVTGVQESQAEGGKGVKDKEETT